MWHEEALRAVGESPLMQIVLLWFGGVMAVVMVVAAVVSRRNAARALRQHWLQHCKSPPLSHPGVFLTACLCTGIIFLIIAIDTALNFDSAEDSIRLSVRGMCLIAVSASIYYRRHIAWHLYDHYVQYRIRQFINSAQPLPTDAMGLWELRRWYLVCLAKTFSRPSPLERNSAAGYRDPQRTK